MRHDIWLALANLSENCTEKFSQAKEEYELRALRAEVLGEKGTLTGIMGISTTRPGDEQAEREEIRKDVLATREKIEEQFQLNLARIKGFPVYKFGDTPAEKLSTIQELIKVGFIPEVNSNIKEQLLQLYEQSVKSNGANMRLLRLVSNIYDLIENHFKNELEMNSKNEQT